MTVLLESNITEICHNMPKVELHCHLFGTVRKDTFEYLNKREGSIFTQEDINAYFTRGEKPIGVLRVLRALDSQLIKYPEDLFRMTCEYLEFARSHNILYTEFFWNPTGTVLESKIPFEKAQESIINAIDTMEEKIGITGRLICAIDREADPKFAVEMVDWMILNRSPKVIGIGIDYRENDRPPQLFVEAYKKAKDNGYKLTAHAGEFGMPWTNVNYALNSLKVDRIDHGYTVIDNPKLVDQCLKDNVIFTVVPTNSYYLRTLPPQEWAIKHPIREMVRLGLRVHPNTDDPTLHHVNATKAWEMMVECFGCTISDLKSFCLNGIDAAWVDNDVKEKWRKEWSCYFDPYL